ncbi:MAG: hypothetical protein ABSH35_07565 [Isosphaeraceae bacterium]|jgi:hypothetical protein
MTISAASTQNLQKPEQASQLPETFLSCYDIVNSDALRWGVRLYKVRRDGGEQTHAEQGDAKQTIWSLRKKHKELCRGYGFVVQRKAGQVRIVKLCRGKRDRSDIVKLGGPADV